MSNGISLTQFLSSRSIALGAFFLTVCLLSQSGLAQQRGWDPAEYLKQTDRNNNGQMDPDELEGRLRNYVRKLGFSVEQPVPIADIVNRARGGDTVKEKKQSPKTSSVVRKVPGFGVEQDNKSVNGFSNGATANDPASLESEFGEKIMERVQQTLDSHDRDGSGSLESNEIERARWGRPGPKESDLNSDGILSTRELAERYKLRERNDGGGDRSGNRERARESARRASEEELRNSEESERRRGDGGGGRGGFGGGFGGGGDRGGDGGRGRYREPSGEVSDADARSRARERAREELERRKQEAENDDSESDEESSSDSSSKSTDRYTKFVDGILKQLDKDGDGALNTEEMKKYSRPPKNLDADSDGSVTREEMLAAYSPQAKERSSSSDDEEEGSAYSRRSSGRSSSRSPSSRSSSRSSGRSSRSLFGGDDANGDGLLQMHEFTDEWTMDKINEFKAIDLNNDGMLSSDEYRNRKQ